MKSTEMLRERMNGKKFKSERGDVVTVLNVHVYGSGHQVSFFYSHPNYLFCGLGKFLKLYQHEVIE